MRILLLGALLGSLLGLCSAWLLLDVEFLTDPVRLLLSVVIGLSFAGLVWTFGLVRWIAMRMDRRRRRKASPQAAPVRVAEVEVQFDDDETGEVDLADETWLQAVDLEPSGPIQDDLLYPEADFESVEDEESTTQLVSRSELQALARALMAGETPPPLQAAPKATPPPSSLSPHEVDQLMRQAAGAVEDGRFDEAKDLFTQVIEGAPDHAWAFLGRGRIYLDHSDDNRAMSDFSRAQELMPGAPEPLVAMGDLYFGRKDYLQSIEYLTIALGQDPDNAMALTRRGISLYYRREYEPALADLQRAAQLDPDIPLLASYLARAQRRVRNTSTPAPDRRRR